MAIGLLSNTGQGRISELKAELALLERGWDVWRPSIDNGVDLIAWPYRFQVKSAAKNINDGYAFWLRGDRSVKDKIDFYALHMRTDDVWLVIPLSAFEDEPPRGLTITPRALKTGNTPKWASLMTFIDAWPEPS